MDYRSLMAAKMKSLEKVRANLAELENAKTKMLQEGLELQGAIKQLNELMQAEEAVKEETPVTPAV